MKDNMSPVSIVLVGIGGYGNNYLNAALEEGGSRGVKIAGAVDPAFESHPELGRLRELGIPCCRDLEEFYLKNSSDLAVISAPIQYHAPLAELAMKHGSNVLCEKPAAANMAQVGKMVAAEKQYGKFLAIGYQWAFNPGMLKLKQDILDGVYGKPEKFKALVLWPRSKSYYNRSPWAGRKSINGTEVNDSSINNAHAHYLFNTLFLLGDSIGTAAWPKSIQGEMYRANPIENFDTAAMRIITRSGVEVLFYSSHAVRSAVGPVCRYLFENGEVIFDGTSFRGIPAAGKIIDYGNPNTNVMEKMWKSADAIRTGNQVVCDIRAAAAQTRCVESLAASGEIQQFSSELIGIEQRDDDDQLTYLDWLSETMLLAYEREVLPAGNGGTIWSYAGSKVDVPPPEWQ